MSFVSFFLLFVVPLSSILKKKKKKKTLKRQKKCQKNDFFVLVFKGRKVLLKCIYKIAFVFKGFMKNSHFFSIPFEINSRIPYFKKKWSTTNKEAT
jgi:hypothetical protein